MCGELSAYLHALTFGCLGLLQVASALMARHIGGAVNYVGVADSLAMGPSAQTAGLAADNLVTALHFIVLFQLARHIPPDPAEGPAGTQGGAGNPQPEHKQGQGGRAPSGIQVLRSAQLGCHCMWHRQVQIAKPGLAPRSSGLLSSVVIG